MHPQQFLEEMVRPTVENAVDDDLDLRKTMCAIFMADALVAHVHYSDDTDISRKVAEFNTGDDLEFRQAVAEQCPDCGLLRDAAKALKHVELKRGEPRIGGASDLKQKKLGYGEAYGVAYGGGKKIVIELKDGDRLNALAVVKRSVDFIEKYFL